MFNSRATCLGFNFLDGNHFSSPPAPLSKLSDFSPQPHSLLFFDLFITQWYLGGQDGLISPNYRIRTKGIDRAGSLHQIMLQFSHLEHKEECYLNRKVSRKGKGIKTNGGLTFVFKKDCICFSGRRIICPQSVRVHANLDGMNSRTNLMPWNSEECQCRK